MTAGDALGLLHHAALADARLAEDNDERFRHSSARADSAMADGERHRTSSSPSASSSTDRQTKPVTDSAGRAWSGPAPYTAVWSSICRYSAIALRKSAAESGRRRGSLRRYRITASAIGAGTSGLTSARGRGLSLGCAAHQRRIPSSLASGNGYRPESSS